MYYKTVYQSPVGTLTLACDETGGSLVGLWIEGQKYYAATLSTDAEKQETPVHLKAASWLTAYFNGQAPEIDFPLKPKGSSFRQAVWEVLRSIPYGATTTYGAIAAQLSQITGKGTSARAVGGAVGHNPISLMIPCHRVVGTNGSLTGYGGGIARKVKLLELERADMHGLFVPKKETAL